MKKTKRKILKVIANFNNQGSAFIDIAVKIAIGVIAGSFIIEFLDGNLQSVFDTLFTKIEEVLAMSINVS